jgi:hypothetical protein
VRRSTGTQPALSAGDPAAPDRLPWGVARYPNKPQALVDYAGVIGVAWLRDPAGRLITSSCSPEPQELAPADAPLAARLTREVPRAPGVPCTEAGTHVLKLSGYTMTILSAAGITPSAVRARLDGCRRLLRAMGEAPWQGLLRLERAEDVAVHAGEPEDACS